MTFAIDSPDFLKISLNNFIICKYNNNMQLLISATFDALILKSGWR